MSPKNARSPCLKSISSSHATTRLFYVTLSHMHHEFFMRRCLELAEQGRGHTGINPLVGSVLVRGGSIVAEGWHAGFGQDHAERMLIKKFDQQIDPGDTLYVNLEPCCHHGKTPPCTDVIIESGIRNIVYGMRDPNPSVAGKGIERLREEGISVVGPLLPELCRRLNKGYVSLKEQGRPFITMKKAQLRSGEISNSDGSPLKITSPKQDEWSHIHFRAKHDAILVGSQTVRTDNPHLNVRYTNKKVAQTSAQSIRLILNSMFNISLDSNVLNDEAASRTILITSPDSSCAYEGEILERGVRILRIPILDGVFDWNSLWCMLTTPDEDFYGISSILVEGGRKTWDIFTSSGFVDEEVLLISKCPS